MSRPNVRPVSRVGLVLIVALCSGLLAGCGGAPALSKVQLASKAPGGHLEMANGNCHKCHQERPTVDQ